LKKRYKKYRQKRKERLLKQFIRRAGRTVKKGAVKGLAEYTQHGHTDRLTHSLAVAYVSCKLADKLRLRCDKKSMIRGALLHDYFHYRWQDDPKKYRLHGFTHPRSALANAEKDFRLNPIEKDIIRKHMFPLTLTPPRYKESALVSAADKICAVYEFFSRSPYKKLSGIFK